MADQLSRSIKSTEHELSWANRGLKANTAEDGKNYFNGFFFFFSISIK